MDGSAYMDRENLPPMQIGSVVSEIPEAESIFINQMVYDLTRSGEDVTCLSLGEAFFDIPLFDVKALDITKSYHYSDSRGLPELRDKIAEFYTRHYNAPVDGDKEILISAGSKPIIFMALLTALNTDDEILIHEPAWVSYQEQARLARVVPKFIPYDCPCADFARYITPKTKMVIINNPNNPAGKLYSREELTTVYEICRSRGIYLMVDEAYSDFVINQGFISLAEIVPDKDGIIIVNSLSKNMGISGWRIGYAISSPTFIDMLLKVNQHVITCAPTILLQYVAKYFDDLLKITLPQVEEVVHRRERVGKMMDRLGIERLDGGTTFYFFAGIGNFPGTSRDFALWLLLDKKIAVVPGSAYGDSTDRFVRVSIGTESEERIWDALNHISALGGTNQFDHEALARRVERFNKRYR